MDILPCDNWAEDNFFRYDVLDPDDRTKARPSLARHYVLTPSHEQHRLLEIKFLFLYLYIYSWKIIILK